MEFKAEKPEENLSTEKDVIQAPEKPGAVLPVNKSRKPEGIVLTAIFHFLLALPGLLVGLVILAIPIPVVIMTVDDPVGLSVSLVTLGLCVLLFVGSAKLYILAGYGLLRGWKWARWLAIGLAMVICLFVPIGTLAGAAVILYLLSSEVRQVFEN
jgi:hypothetical protein